MLKTTLTTIKKVCIFTLVPRACRERVRYTPGKYEKLPGVIAIAEKSSDSKDKYFYSKSKYEDEREKAQRIIDYAFGKGEYPSEIIAEFHKALMEELKMERLMNQELERLKEKLALREILNEKSCQNCENIETEQYKLLASTERDDNRADNKKIFQNLEKVEKPTLVGAEPSQKYKLLDSTERDDHRADIKKIFQNLEKYEKPTLLGVEPSQLEDVDDLKTIPPLIGHRCECEIDEKSLKNIDEKIKPITAQDIAANAIKKSNQGFGPFMDSNLKHCCQETKKQVQVFFSDPKRKSTEFNSPENGDITKVTLTEREEALVREIEKLAVKQKLPISPAMEEAEEDIFKHSSEKQHNDSATETNGHQSQIDSTQQLESEDPWKVDRTDNYTPGYLYPRIEEQHNNCQYSQINIKDQASSSFPKYVQNSHDKVEKIESQETGSESREDEAENKKNIKDGNSQNASVNSNLFSKEPITENVIHNANQTKNINLFSKWLAPRDHLADLSYKDNNEKPKLNDVENTADKYTKSGVSAVTEVVSHQTVSENAGNKHTISHDMDKFNNGINVSTAQNHETENVISEDPANSGSNATNTGVEGSQSDINIAPKSIGKYNTEKSEVIKMCSRHEDCSATHDQLTRPQASQTYNLQSNEQINANSIPLNQQNYNATLNKETISASPSSTLNPDIKKSFDDWYQKQTISQAHIQFLQGNMTPSSTRNTDICKDQMQSKNMLCEMPSQQKTSNPEVYGKTVSNPQEADEKEKVIQDLQETKTTTKNLNLVQKIEQGNTNNIQLNQHNQHNHHVTSNEQTFYLPAETVSTNNLMKLEPNDKNNMPDMPSNEHHYLLSKHQSNIYNIPLNLQNYHVTANEQNMYSSPESDLKNLQWNKQNPMYNMPSYQPNHLLSNDHRNAFNMYLYLHNNDVTSNEKNIGSSSETIGTNHQKHCMYNMPPSHHTNSLSNKQGNSCSVSSNSHNYNISSDVQIIGSTSETMATDNKKNIYSKNQNLDKLSNTNTIISPDSHVTSDEKSMCLASKTMMTNSLQNSQSNEQNFEHNHKQDMPLNIQDQSMTSDYKSIHSSKPEVSVQDTLTSNLNNLHYNEQNQQNMPWNHHNYNLRYDIHRTATTPYPALLKSKRWSDMLRVELEQIEFLKNQSKLFCYDQNPPRMNTNDLESQLLQAPKSINDQSKQNNYEQFIQAADVPSQVFTKKEADLLHKESKNVVDDQSLQTAEVQSQIGTHQESEEYYNKMNQLYGYGSQDTYLHKSWDRINSLQPYETSSQNQNRFRNDPQRPTEKQLENFATKSMSMASVTETNINSHNLYHNKNQNLTYSSQTETSDNLPIHENKGKENESNIPTANMPFELQHNFGNNMRQKSLKHFENAQNQNVVEDQITSSMSSKLSEYPIKVNDKDISSFRSGEICLDISSPVNSPNTESYVYRDHLSAYIPKVKKDDRNMTKIEPKQLSDLKHEIQHLTKVIDLDVANQKPDRLYPFQHNNRNIGKLGDLLTYKKKRTGKEAAIMKQRAPNISKLGQIRFDFDSKKIIDDEDILPKPSFASNMSSSSPINAATASTVMTASRIHQPQASETENITLPDSDATLSRISPKYYERLGHLMDAVKSTKNPNLKEVISNFKQSNKIDNIVSLPHNNKDANPPNSVQIVHNKKLNQSAFELKRTNTKGIPSKLDFEDSCHAKKNVKYYQRLGHLIKLTRELDRYSYQYMNVKPVSVKKSENVKTVKKTRKEEDIYKDENKNGSIDTKSNTIKCHDTQKKEDISKQKFHATDTVAMQAQYTGAMHKNNMHRLDFDQSKHSKSDFSGGEIILSRNKVDSNALDLNKFGSKHELLQPKHTKVIQHSKATKSIEQNIDSSLEQNETMKGENQEPKTVVHKSKEIDTISEKAQVNITVNVGPLPAVKNKSDEDIRKLLDNIRIKNHLKAIDELQKGAMTKYKTKEDVSGKCGDPKKTCPEPTPECKPKSDPCKKPPSKPEPCPPPKCPPPCPPKPPPQPCPPPKCPPPCPPPESPPKCPPPESPPKCPPKLPPCPPTECFVGVPEWQKYPEIIIKDMLTDNVGSTVSEAYSANGVDISKASSSKDFDTSSIRLIRGTRNYEPWAPIPSWPVPKKYSRKPFRKQCEPEQTKPKPLQRYPREPGCKGFPKRLTYSETEFHVDFQ